MSEKIFNKNGLQVTSFAGGVERGRCLQFDAVSAQFTFEEMLVLLPVLTQWAFEQVNYKNKQRSE